MPLAMLIMKKEFQRFYFYACMWFCSYSYGAALGDPSGRRSSAANTYIPLFLDFDECTAKVNPCDAVANSECKNTYGSYSCPCKDGFVKIGPYCEGATHFLSLVWISSILF